MASLYEILRRPLEQRINSYGSKDISKLIIDGEEFKGYKTFSSFWEKTYKDEPTRSIAGVIDNLNSYPTFTTFHIVINYAMMSIDDYRRLYRLMLSKNEFVVTAYDSIKNMPYTCKMYFAPDQMPKLYAMARRLNGNKFVEVLGVQDYTIELIGTNADIETISIIFKDEYGNTIHTKQARANEEIEIYYNYQPKNEGEEWYEEWQVNYGDGNIGETLYNGDVIVPSEYGIIEGGENDGESFVDLYKYMILTPIVYGTKEYKLTLDFGLGIVPQATNSDIFPSTINISYGDNIAQTIVDENIYITGENTSIFSIVTIGGFSYTKIRTPNVTYNGKEYSGESAYTFDGWHLVKDAKARISASTTYDYEFNRTIYAQFKKRIYTVWFNFNEDGVEFAPLENVPYDSDVVVPFMRKNGKKLVWYWLDGDTEVEFNGKMPPFVLYLYGKWVDE